MRTCVACGATKPADEFNRDRKQPDGLRRRCRACTRKEMAAWRAANPEYQRDYLATHRAEQIAHNRQERDRFPEKRAARRQLQWAVESGKVIRPDLCSSCGATGRIEAHHTDYARPLDVLWLCVGCHRQKHMEAAA